jgi:hypothetical protein
VHILMTLLVHLLLPGLRPSLRGFFTTLSLVVGGMYALSVLRAASGKTYSFNV